MNSIRLHSYAHKILKLPDQPDPMTDPVVYTRSSPKTSHHQSFLGLIPQHFIGITSINWADVAWEVFGIEYRTPEWDFLFGPDEKLTLHHRALSALTFEDLTPGIKHLEEHFKNYPPEHILPIINGYLKKK